MLINIFRAQDVCFLHCDHYALNDDDNNNISGYFFFLKKKESGKRWLDDIPEREMNFFFHLQLLISHIHDPPGIFFPP